MNARNYPVILLVLLFSALATVSNANSPVKESDVVGANAPQFTATDIEGNRFTLDSLLERYDVVVLSFWGLRCGACIEEMPHLNAIYRKYSGKIALLGINVDAVDGAFLKENMEKMQIVMDYEVVPDPEFSMADIFKMTAAPLTIVIDSDGVIQYRHDNYESGDEKELEEVIRSLLDGEKLVVK